MKDVAAHAGVSPMTVSRTLAGGTNVRPDVQERVLRSVEELGYYRNENARSIRPGQTSGLIGVAITNIANPYYGTFALGVEEEVARTGRRIILGNTAEDGAREQQLVHDLLGRRVEGLIVVPTDTDGVHLARSRNEGVPVVLASRRVEGVDADSVVLDDAGGAYAATMALLDAGHRRIAYLGNTRSIYTGRRRYDGFVAAHAEKGIEVDPELAVPGQQDVASAQHVAARLLDLDEPPTAIFCANNRNTVGAVTEITRRVRDGRLDAGAAPALVSFDDFELSDVVPTLVGIVEHDPRELGRCAARLLLDRLDGDADQSARDVVLPVHLRPNAV
ncbi:LacI family DNA-binding transcriptional regulator [Microbacterium aurantiacum]|uniref:LacI family DNA-binding transcriptional regulator n=1 Tax=Microbacterium aurantiacum TaxID=162393 RepID=UPI004036F04F